MNNYLVRILPNNMILVINQKTNERKTLKPRELRTYFENELKEQIEAWDEFDNNFSKIQDELSRL